MAAKSGKKKAKVFWSKRDASQDDDYKVSVPLNKAARIGSPVAGEG